MKTHTKISTLAVVYALCAGVAMPTFAAPSVRALGGAGTYSSASSATQAKTGTASTAQKAETVRGGSLSVDSGTSSAGAKTVTNKVSGTVTGARGSSARSASVRVPSSARLSIGKYLGGASVSQPPKQCIPGEPGCDTPTPSEDFIEYDISYDEDTYRLTIYDKTNRVEVMSRDVASHKALESLREDLTELERLVGSGELDTEAVTIIAAINELVAGKQDKLIAGDGIAIDDNEISVRVGEGLDIKNGVIVTDIDAPIQKQIIQGKGIEILVGAKEDAVKVKLAEKDSNLTFDSAGGLRVDLPEGGVQEKLEAGTGISQAELDAGKIGVNILPNGEGGLVVQDGYLQTAIEFPENPQKEIAAGNGIAVSVGEDKDTVEVKLAEKDSNLTFDSAGGLRVDLPEGGVQEKLNAGTGIKIDGNTISTNFEVEQNSKTYLDIKEENGKQIFVLSHLPDPDGNFIYKSGQGVSVGAENALNLNLRAANETIILENQDDGTVLIKANIPENMPSEVQKALTAGVAVSADALADGQISFMYDGKSGLRINENNQVAVSLGSGLKFDEDGKITTDITLKEYKGTDAIEVITSEDGKEATVKLKVDENDDRLQVTPDGLSLNLHMPAEVQAALTAGAGILIDTDNKISANLIAGDRVKITDVTMEDGSEAKEISISLDGNDNTVYAAGDGIKISEVEGENKISINATAEGFYLYNVDASGKGVWQQVQIVDVTDVNTSAEATN